jgi:hypothetical protein
MMDNLPMKAILKHISVHRQTAARLSEIVAMRRNQGRRPLECTRDSVIWDALELLIEKEEDNAD